MVPPQTMVIVSRAAPDYGVSLDACSTPDDGVPAQTVLCRTSCWCFHDQRKQVCLIVTASPPIESFVSEMRWSRLRWPQPGKVNLPHLLLAGLRLKQRTCDLERELNVNRRQLRALIQQQRRSTLPPAAMLVPDSDMGVVPGAGDVTLRCVVGR